MAYFMGASRITHMVCRGARGFVANGFGLTEEAEFGAHIQLVDLQWSRIFINRGTHSIISATVNRILADSRVLRNVGDSSLETIKAPTLKDFYNNFESMLAAEGVVIEVGDAPVLPPIRPRCPVRAAYADLIIDLAIDFVVAHEVMHHCNGHRGYLLAAGRGEVRQPTDLERRALEYDADQSAMCQVAPANNLRFAQFPPDHPLKDRSFTDQLHDLGFAHGIIALVQQEAIRTHQRFKTHPSVLVRMEAALLLLIEIVAPSPLSLREREAAVGGGAATATVGYVATTGKPLEPMPFQSKAAFEDEVRELRRGWASIRPLVEPFSCRTLAAVHSSVEMPPAPPDNPNL